MKKIIFTAAMLLLAVLAFFVWHKKTPKSQIAVIVDNLPEQKQEVKAPEPPPTGIALNGKEVSLSAAQKRPVAVMVENYPDARPQSGLTDADLVYETLAEGGITRFMVVYQTGSPNNVGPIRSARTYFAELADELHAIYAHVGGNSDVLENIKQDLYKNIGNADQFFDDGIYFHRIKTRLAPHNVYTSLEKMYAFAQSRKYDETADFKPWLYKDEVLTATSTNPAASITIDFSLPQYLVKYVYDPQANQYKRFLAGKPHTDLDSGKQITAKNIAVQYINIFPVKSDTPLSIGMTLTGQGKAVVFLDGQAIKGTWKKTPDDRTRFYDEQGQEIKFNRGTTWVELVPTDRAVTWK